ncbi:hypothetical protein [Sagittula sp. SSi028]|uniref:hypothetical protein n=1 Tax=Sagittula sp. SSi028 TaxID=3400636 RepID=UPI003AF5A11F
MHADPIAALLQSLQTQDYNEIVVQRTFLGRIRVIARGDETQREIVVHPSSGAVLRDYSRGVTARSERVPPSVIASPSGRDEDGDRSPAARAGGADEGDQSAGGDQQTAGASANAAPSASSKPSESARDNAKSAAAEARDSAKSARDAAKDAAKGAKSASKAAKDTAKPVSASAKASAKADRQ